MPVTVIVEGREYSINSDFRTCLRTILAFEDNDLTPQEKAVIVMRNLYSVAPENAELAFEAAINFLNGGDVSEDDMPPKTYSFSKDSGLIFAAFRQTHGIDLEATEMHWWKFLTLFSDLGANSAFCNLVSMRLRVKTGKATKEERAAARDLGDMFEVPEIDTRTFEEKEAEALFMNKMQGATNG